MNQIALRCDRLNSNSIECDRCTLNLLRPYLIQTQQESAVLHQIQPLLKQAKHVLEQGGIIGLTSDSQVQFITPHAEHLLNQYFPFWASHELPEPLQHWFTELVAQSMLNCASPYSLQIEQAGRQLMIHLVPDLTGEHYLLLLEEQPVSSFSITTLQVLGLTKREAEVLFWISKDKSNAAIAKILGCCEGTVRKHLENLYRKLGVQTRMGAVMVALKQLGLLKE